MHKSLFERSYLPDGDAQALPDALTIRELAELRASSIDGLDQALYERLLARMSRQARIGRLTVDSRRTPVWTGSYHRTEVIEDGPLAERGKPRQVTFQSLAGGPPPGAQKEYVDQVDQVVTKAAAHRLFLKNSENWSDEAKGWCGAGDRLANVNLASLGFTDQEIDSLRGEEIKNNNAIRELARLGFPEQKLERLFNKDTPEWIRECRVRSAYFHKNLLFKAIERAIPRPQSKKSPLSVVGP